MNNPIFGTSMGVTFSTTTGAPMRHRSKRRRNRQSVTTTKAGTSQMDGSECDKPFTFGDHQA